MDIHQRHTEAAPVFAIHADSLTWDLGITPRFVATSGGWCLARAARGFRLTEASATTQDKTGYKHIVEGYGANPAWELTFEISIGEDGEFIYKIINGDGCADDDQATQMSHLLFEVLPGSVYNTLAQNGNVTIDGHLFARVTEAVNDLLQRILQDRAA